MKRWGLVLGLTVIVAAMLVWKRTALVASVRHTGMPAAAKTTPTEAPAPHTVPYHWAPLPPPPARTEGEVWAQSRQHMEDMANTMKPELESEVNDALDRMHLPEDQA